ncbi:MAG TPA: single-stranded-DNA-specific exonuclease RecJ [Candidatus Magasanikbacteria bacterium]|nr:single-stranded-DNA-specific exonuclease RecJ [Candidatus Magasanikbacteria bacterium]
MLKKWDLLPPPKQEFLDSYPELPLTVATLLYHRGIITQSAIDEFLDPDYTKYIYDPFLFRDMKKALQRIFRAIEKKEKIVVHGDYDADGVSAATILTQTLRTIGADRVDVYLPHRETDGYGLNLKTVTLLHDQGANLIITCDCGISNKPEIELANSFGIDVIVTDHHAIPETLPPAHAIIHPKVPGETYPDTGLCGAAVAFKLAQGLLRNAAKNGVELPLGISYEGYEKWMLDLVAIATVADMVPLLGESRTLTKFGLIVLNRTKRIGLQKLLLEARLRNEDGTNKREFNTETIGFQISPRINAAGRMNHANVAYNLLNTEDPTEATDLAFELNKNNLERQKMTEDLVKRAIEQIERDQKDLPTLIVVGRGWSTGIVGLIAGKIKEKYWKPTLVVAINKEEVTGSGRSIDGFDLISALQSMPEFFHKFGGHPMACGFTLKDEKTIPEFHKRLTEKFLADTSGHDIAPTIQIDAEVNLDEVDWGLYDILNKFEPFGQCNEKPLYLARGLTVLKTEPVGTDGKHLRIMVQHNSNRIRKTIGWNLNKNFDDTGTNWGNSLKKGDKIDMVFEIGVNQWNGNRELQFTIVDLKKIK